MVFQASARSDLSSFFRAVNLVITVLKDAHENILLKLLYTNCIPMLTYACLMKEFSASGMSCCNVAVNNVFQKSFGLSHWESICGLCQQVGLKSIYEIFKRAHDKFAISCFNHHNPVVSLLARMAS